MGISETRFWGDVEAVEQRHRRSRPAKPRTVCVQAALAAVEAIDRERASMESRLRAAADRLARLRDEAPELVAMLDMSNSRWREAAGERVLSATLRDEMAKVRDRGVARIMVDIEAWWRTERKSADAEVARAEAMPADAAAEAAWRQWEERSSREIDAMHGEYEKKGAWS